MFKRLLTFLGKLLFLPVVLVLLPIYLLLKKLGWVSNFQFQIDMAQAKSAEARYLQHSDPTGLDDSITAWERILQHPDWAMTTGKLRLKILHGSAITYWHHYGISSDVADLDRALLHWQGIRDLIPVNSPELPSILTNLGNGLSERYSGCTGIENDLKNAVDYYRQAVALTPTNSPVLAMYLNNLGVGLTDCYTQTGAENQLEEAMSHYQQAVDLTPANSPGLPGYLNNLGTALRNCYARTGEINSLEEGIAVFQQAVDLTPTNSPELPKLLNNLGEGLRTYYLYCKGRKGDLENAIKHYQRSLDLTSANSPDRPNHLNNLGEGLRDRYALTGAITDLEKAIEYYRQAVKSTPTKSPRLPLYFNNLGEGLRNLYARTDKLNNLEEAIEYYQQAVKLIPTSSPDRSMYLNNLGQGLTEHYVNTGKVNDLELGIVAFQQAINLTPAGSPELFSPLNNLGNSLTYRYTLTDVLNDLEEAINIYQQAVTLTPANSPELPSVLNNLGTGLRDRYARTDDLIDLQKGISAFQRAAQRGLEVALEGSLRASRNWIHWAFSDSDPGWEEVTQAYSCAYQAGQRLLQAQLLRDHKESWLKDMQGLASQAAYAFTKLKQPKEAVVALERGIARLLSEALQRDRANLEQLETRGHTELYNCYKKIDERYHWAQQQQNVEALKTAKIDLDKTIEDIRQVPGYENFLKPVEFDLIQTATQETPLVYILTTSAGGLALIVRKEEITPVWLDELTETVLREKLRDYLNVYGALSNLWLKTAGKYLKETFRVHFDACRLNNTKAWLDAIEETTLWLWQVLWQPLREKLPNQQRLTLIPVGWLNLLPLHAAWTADPTQPTGRRYTLDEVTIAYAPNAVSLQKARDLATHIQCDKLLAIDEPKPVKANPLPSSSVEVNAITRHFTQPQLLRHEAATQETVKNTLNLNYNVLHFSCHGGANLANPLKTGLVMANDEMLTVQHFLDAKLKARLATLSACETGMIGTKNIEEVVGLPASLLQAGVAGVVASLWSVNELSTALLMIRFYDYWLGEEKLTPVEALRQAQIWLRDSTEAKKFEYVEKQRQNTQGTTRIAYNRLRGALNKDSTERKYAHPYYWGAFGFTGV